MQTTNNQPTTTFYSNGKLLISAEYLVLDGAIALALPTKYGQELRVSPIKNSKNLIWKSFDVKNGCWFEAEFDLISFNVLKANATYGDVNKVASTLKDILNTARKLNSHFLISNNGLNVETHLTFPNEWGLGTSSTLINSIATWANINAFDLLEKSFGGSGYDIACAQNNTGIFYTRNGIHPTIQTINFNPQFKDNIFFVYLNQKQDSKEGIKMYRELKRDKSPIIEKINKITLAISQASSIEKFEQLILQHETLLSNLLGIPPVKQKLFPDFNGQVKSLGAWGGDFVLVTGNKEYVSTYFKQNNFHTVLSYDQMIL